MGKTEIDINLQVLAADKLFKGLTSRKYRILRHAIGILFLVALILARKKWGEYRNIIDHFDWIFCLFFIISLFYINMYKLTPHFIYRGKAFMYLISLGMLNITAGLILACFHYYILQPNRIIPIQPDFNWIGASIIVSIFFVPFLLLSSALKLLQRWIDDINTINELEKRAVESELAALRNQIHPHFLFNMLNNINVLTATQPQKASYIIVKLSSFLRHLIYETDHSNHIYLTSEIKFIEDYLELEKIRRDHFSYTLEYNERELRGIKAPANILIILVENAIKHSADTLKESFVKITFSIKDGYFHFRAINSIPAIKANKNDSSGAGLINIKRRLELLYSSHSGYDLHFKEEDKLYTAVLKLPYK